MTERNYIELYASDGTTGGKFQVIREGYRNVLHKKSTVEETMDGGLDVVMGGIHEIFQFTIRVRGTDPDGFGTRYDLEDLYRLNSPFDRPTAGVSSNKIAMKTHTMDDDDDPFYVYMIGDFDASLLGCRIEGQDAIWDVNVLLRRIPDAN